MAAKGPTALATSLAPWAKDTAAAEMTCRYLNTCTAQHSTHSTAQHETPPAGGQSGGRVTCGTTVGQSQVGQPASMPRHITPALPSCQAAARCRGGGACLLCAWVKLLGLVVRCRQAVVLINALQQEGAQGGGGPCCVSAVLQKPAAAFRHRAGIRRQQAMLLLPSTASRSQDSVAPHIKDVGIDAAGQGVEGALAVGGGGLVIGVHRLQAWQGTGRRD